MSSDCADRRCRRASHRPTVGSVRLRRARSTGCLHIGRSLSFIHSWKNEFLPSLRGSTASFAGFSTRLRARRSSSRVSVVWHLWTRSRLFSVRRSQTQVPRLTRSSHERPATGAAASQSGRWLRADRHRFAGHVLFRGERRGQSCGRAPFGSISVCFRASPLGSTVVDQKPLRPRRRRRRPPPISKRGKRELSHRDNRCRRQAPARLSSMDPDEP